MTIIQERVEEGLSTIAKHGISARPLAENLAALAAFLGVSGDHLAAFAAEDTLGGYEDGWEPGSAWGSDLKLLYAAIRWLEPEHVLEVGTYAGCSAATILAALHRNGFGDLTCVDNNPDAGWAVPDLRERATVVAADARTWLANAGPFDLVFEDGPHEYGYESVVLPLIAALRPRLLIAHDPVAPHWNYGEQVCRAWREAFGEEPFVLVTEPSPCGIAIRRFE